MARRKTVTAKTAHPAVLEAYEGELGPAMLALPTDRMRAWVDAVVRLGAGHKVAAKIAGYSGNAATLAVCGHRLAHDERVIAALAELARKMVRAATIASVRYLAGLVENEDADHRDRVKAAQLILDRGGLPAHTEHKLTIEDSRTDQQKIDELRAFAQRLRIDERTVLGEAGYPADGLLPPPADVIDATFETVARPVARGINQPSPMIGARTK
jgi:hypothetical protein